MKKRVSALISAVLILVLLSTSAYAAGPDAVTPGDPEPDAVIETQEDEVPSPAEEASDPSSVDEPIADGALRGLHSRRRAPVSFSKSERIAVTRSPCSAKESMQRRLSAFSESRVHPESSSLFSMSEPCERISSKCASM